MTKSGLPNKHQLRASMSVIIIMKFSPSGEYRETFFDNWKSENEILLMSIEYIIYYR